jgi:hypothetical protein
MNTVTSVVSHHQGKMFTRTWISQRNTKKINKIQKNTRKEDQAQHWLEVMVSIINQTNLHNK